MTAEAKERYDGERDGEITPGAARAGQRHARRERRRDEEGGKETQRIPRMEKSDGDHRAAEIVREIVGLAHCAEHPIGRLRGNVDADAWQWNVVILNEPARGCEEARCCDPPLQRARE